MRPLPSDDATPPVTKTCLAVGAPGPCSTVGSHRHPAAPALCPPRTRRGAGVLPTPCGPSGSREATVTPSAGGAVSGAPASSRYSAVRWATRRGLVRPGRATAPARGRPARPGRPGRRAAPVTAAASAAASPTGHQQPGVGGEQVRQPADVGGHQRPARPQRLLGHQRRAPPTGWAAPPGRPRPAGPARRCGGPSSTQVHPGGRRPATAGAPRRDRPRRSPAAARAAAGRAGRARRASTSKPFCDCSRPTASSSGRSPSTPSSARTSRPGPRRRAHRRARATGPSRTSRPPSARTRAVRSLDAPSVTVGPAGDVALQPRHAPARRSPPPSTALCQVTTSGAAPTRQREAGQQPGPQPVGVHHVGADQVPAQDAHRDQVPAGVRGPRDLHRVEAPPRARRSRTARRWPPDRAPCTRWPLREQPGGEGAHVGPDPAGARPEHQVHAQVRHRPAAFREQHPAQVGAVEDEGHRGEAHQRDRTGDGGVRHAAADPAGAQPATAPSPSPAAGQPPRRGRQGGAGDAGQPGAAGRAEQPGQQQSPRRRVIPSGVAQREREHPVAPPAAPGPAPRRRRPRRASRRPSPRRGCGRRRGRRGRAPAGRAARSRPAPAPAPTTPAVSAPDAGRARACRAPAPAPPGPATATSPATPGALTSSVARRVAATVRGVARLVARAVGRGQHAGRPTSPAAPPAPRTAAGTASWRR